MDAVVKLARGPGNVSLTQMPYPKPSPDQVLLKVITCGICGTDLHVRNDTFRNYPPVILGHEFVARVVEEGAQVKGKTRPDTRYSVLGATTIVCGECDHCKSGYFMFCPNRRGMGHGVNGAFAPFICARPDQLFPLDDNVKDDEGALVEPLAVAVAAVGENTKIRPGDVALVSGPGPIGLLVTMVLTFQGIRTIVAGTSKDAMRLAKAKELGACQTVAVDMENLAESIDLETKGKGVDVAFETSGAAASVSACLEALRPLGSYTQVGHFGRDITVPFDHVAFKQLRIQGTVGYTHATWKRTLRLMANGLQATRIVSHRFPLSRWEEGFNTFENKKAIKVLLYPQT